MKIYGVIYLIRNIINNKIYVGQTTNTFDVRYSNNLEKYTSNEHLKKSIQKYGINNFYIDKEFDKAYSKEELDKLEDLYIKIYKSNNRLYGYNKKTGGSNGKPCKESVLKQAKSMKGKLAGEKHPLYGTHRSKETREKISKNQKGRIAWNKGMHLSEEQKSKISKNRKGKCCGKNNCNYGKTGEKNHLYGTHRSDETKNKISQKLTGIKRSEEYKKKLSEIHKGKMTGKNHPLAKKVICITTGKVFDTTSEAAMYYGIHQGHISTCCRGIYKYTGKLKDGTKLVWKYYEDYIKQ